MKLYNQLLLQGLAGIILRLTIVSVQRGTCAIIKVECCVYIPDLSGYISATLDDMKGQVKVMSDDNLPFWTSVLSWVNGDWWKTIFTIIIVALIVLLSGPFILQCIMNFVTQRLMSFSQIGGRRVRVQYIPMNDAHTMSKEHQEVGNEGGNRQNRLHLESRTPSWAGLWTLSCMPSIYGNDIPAGKPDPPRWKSPRARTYTLCCLREYPNYLCN